MQLPKGLSEADLQFKEVDNPAPRTLSPDEIAAFNREGYLKPFRIFDEAEAEANRAYFDDLLHKIQQADNEKDSYAVNGYQVRCKGIYELVRNPRIVDLVADLIGPDVVCWATHYFCKLPHDPKAVPWHQDASYWPLRPARTVTVWLAIDDADEENSAMKVIPGTHRMGPLKWKQTQQDAVLGQEIVGVEELGEPVSFNLNAGEISLHADMLAHGSEPNRSARRRCGLTIRYCPPDVEATVPHWADNAVLCRGEAPSEGWRFPPAPEDDEVGTGPKPASIGGN